MSLRLSATALAFAVVLAALFTAVQIEPESRLEDIPRAAESRRCASKFGSLDNNSDGALSAQELDKLAAAVNRVDINNDAKITAAEYQSACVSGTLREKDIKS